MRILIIEDEYNLADAISSFLKEEKYYVDINVDGEKGLCNALTGVYDLIILDVMLPKVNGFKILKELRDNNINSKVIMLTAKSNIDDKIYSFNSGADDYLTKPFYMEELVARVNLQLRKKEVFNKDYVLEVFDLKLNIKSFELTCTSTLESISVIGKEFLLLEMFMRNPNIILEKEQIFVKIWGYDAKCELNNLEAYISFIRKKLKLIGSCVRIKVIRNIGYRFEVKDEEVKS